MRLIGISEAARQLNLKPYSIRKLARAGKLPHIFVAGKYLFDLAALESYFAASMFSKTTLASSNSRSDGEVEND